MLGALICRELRDAVGERRVQLCQPDSLFDNCDPQRRSELLHRSVDIAVDPRLLINLNCLSGRTVFMPPSSSGFDVWVFAGDPDSVARTVSHPTHSGTRRRPRSLRKCQRRPIDVSEK